MYASLYSQVDYGQFVEYIPEASFARAPAQAVAKAVRRVEPRINEYRQYMHKAERDLMYGVALSRVASNMLTEYAQTCRIVTENMLEQ